VYANEREMANPYNHSPGVLYGVGVVRSGWLRRGMHLEKYSSIRHDYYIFFLLTKFAENSQEVILKYLIKTFHASF